MFSINTLKINTGKTKIIAHRGLSGIECENTCAAFVAAANRSYMGIETDVHITADGKFVLIHDGTTKRVSKSDLNVEESSFDELRAQRLIRPDGYTRGDYIIPTLEEYIEICRRYEKQAVLELKERFKREDIEKIVKVIRKTGGMDNVIFISFKYGNLADLREILPKQSLQYLVRELDEDTLKKIQKLGLDIDIKYTALNKENVRLLHSKGIKINCWVCDNKKEAERLVKMGVDYITTNILE